MSEASFSETSESLLEKSMKLLGWERITKALKNHTCSPHTHNLCLNLKPETDFGNAKNQLDETAEMIDLLDSLEPFPIDRFEDIAPILKDLDERQIIETKQCLILIKLLRLCRYLCKDLELFF